MKIDDDASEAAAPEPDADAADEEARRGDEPREKVIVRSDGTVTYVGKDMAYQLWKFGLLGKDFHYRVFETAAGRSAVVDEPSNAGAASRPSRRSAGASWVCNVIDTRQSYLQKLLKQALAALGYQRAGRALGALLVRDGRAVARHRARAGLRHRAPTRIGRSSRCRAARASASRPTTCSIA